MAFHLLLSLSPHHLECADLDQHVAPKQEQQTACLLLTWEGWSRTPGCFHATPCQCLFLPLGGRLVREGN